MVGGDRVKWIAGLIVCAVSVIGLSGCASAGGAEPALTLAQTKSPVQLLRNEAAERMPSSPMEAIVSTEDTSIACKTEADDPKGISRAWTSSMLVDIAGDSAWRTDLIIDDLTTSFVEQGWSAATGPVQDVITTVLTSKTSAVSIELTATLDDDHDRKGASIRIATKGPCVDTAGAESGEVKNLESHK